MHAEQRILGQDSSWLDFLLGRRSAAADSTDRSDSRAQRLKQWDRLREAFQTLNSY